MEIKLQAMRGRYIPSCFTLKVYADCELDDLNKLQPQHLSTFFHEYIHFLQDITTTFGLINTSIISNRIRYFNKEFINHPETTVIMPLPLHNHSSTEINCELQNIYLGTGNSKKHRDRKPTIEGVRLIDTTKNHIQEVIVDYSFSGSNSQFRFGALCLLENMAHIIQCKFYPEVKHPDIPYRTAELIAKFIYPNIGDNFDKVFALCDACLMTFHPGEAFFKILNEMKKDSWSGSAKDIYDYTLDKIITLYGVNSYDLFNEKSDETSSFLQGYFTTSYFDEEKKWIKTVLEQAKSTRLSNPSFLLDLLYSSTLSSKEFVDLLANIGTPLMMNYNDDGWFKPPKNYSSSNIQPHRLAAIYEIFSLFEEGKKKCDLKIYCSCRQNISVDERCINAPWTRYDKKDTCAYMQLWVTWGLFEKSQLTQMIISGRKK